MKSKKFEAKVQNNKELAMIRLIEGKIKFALDDVDGAIEIYNKAKSTIIGIDSYAMDIKGLIDYQFGEIAKKYKEHDNVIELINLSVSNLNQGGSYDTAIIYLFDLVNYIIVNKLQENPFNYVDQIDQLTKKYIKIKKNKKTYLADLSLVKGKFYKNSNLKYAAKEFENAAKIFENIKHHQKHAESLVHWADVVRNSSLRKSEKILKVAIESANKSNSEREKGLALISLAKVKRILNELDDVKNLEKEGFEALIKSSDKEECGDNYVEMSRVITMTSTNDNELSTAIDYATKASKLFDEIDHKYGKTLSLFMQGVNRVAKGYIQEGLSMIKLTTINLNRLKKSEQIEYLNTDASHLAEVITNDLEGDNLFTVMQTQSENLPLVEQGSLYHLASIIKFQTDKDEGRNLIKHSLNIFEKFVKKNTDYQILYDITKERANKHNHDP